MNVGDETAFPYGLPAAGNLGLTKREYAAIHIFAAARPIQHNDENVRVLGGWAWRAAGYLFDCIAQQEQEE